ncbi:hypothetical protein [Mycobacterium sp. E136]|nr:hypothetical protein [Mycobacterium sp. E136]
MTAISTPRLRESNDSFLRFALRADAIASGLMGLRKDADHSINRLRLRKL